MGSGNAGSGVGVTYGNVRSGISVGSGNVGNGIGVKKVSQAVYL
jgi:hypothetical protein